MAVQPIPEGYHSVTPYLILDDATRALEFYKKALGAVELLRIEAQPQVAPVFAQHWPAG